MMEGMQTGKYDPIEKLITPRFLEINGLHHPAIGSVMTE